MTYSHTSKHKSLILFLGLEIKPVKTQWVFACCFGAKQFPTLYFPEAGGDSVLWQIHSVPRQPCALTGGTGQLDVVGLCLAPEGNFFLLGG